MGQSVFPEVGFKRGIPQFVRSETNSTSLITAINRTGKGVIEGLTSFGNYGYVDVIVDGVTLISSSNAIAETTTGTHISLAWEYRTSLVVKHKVAGGTSANVLLISHNILD